MSRKLSSKIAVAALIGMLLTESSEQKRRSILTDLERVLTRRRTRINKIYGISGYQGWYGNLPDYADKLTALFTNDEFLALLRNPLRVVLEKKGEERIFSPKHKKLISAAAVKGRLIFINPYNNNLQVWNQMKIQQPPYHNGKATMHKSTFSPGINVNDLFEEAFQNAVGILQDARKIVLNYKFDHSIGVLKGHQKPTAKCLRIYIERIKGGEKKYQMQVHGHPISEGELSKDLSDYPELEAMLP